MSASNNDGSELYWLDGEPVKDLRKGQADTGTELFWVDGQPVEVLFVPGAQGNFFLVFDF